MQAADYLGSEEKTEIFLRRRASIKFSNLVVKPLGQRVKACVELYRLEGGGSKGPSSFSSTPAATGSSTSASNSIAVAKADAKKKISVSNFFGKESIAKPPLSKSSSDEPKKVQPSPSKSLKRAQRGNDGSESESEVPSVVATIAGIVDDYDDGNDEEEWDEGYKTNKNKIKKRGKIVLDETEDLEEVLDTTLTKEDELLIARSCIHIYILL